MKILSDELIINIKNRLNIICNEKNINVNINNFDIQTILEVQYELLKQNIIDMQPTTIFGIGAFEVLTTKIESNKIRDEYISKGLSFEEATKHSIKHIYNKKKFYIKKKCIIYKSNNIKLIK